MSAAPYAEAMGLALEEAARALAHEDVPVGAVVLDATGAVVGTGHNDREGAGDPTAHAEVLALRAAAAALGSWRLTGCTLVVTLEPCAMCAGAIVNFPNRIRMTFQRPKPINTVAASKFSLPHTRDG